MLHSSDLDYQPSDAASLHELLAQLLRQGHLSSSAVLESFFYAAEEELFVIMRSLAELGPSERARVQAYVAGLASGHGVSQVHEPPRTTQ